MPAGAMRDRFGFARRVQDGNDGYGNEEGAWIEQFVVAAAVTWLQGGESVIAARLQGTQPAVLTIRESLATREITSDWRAEDKRSGTRYAVRSVKQAKQRGYLDVMVIGGRADAEAGNGAV